MTFLKFLFTKTFIKQLGFAIAVLIILSFIVLWWLRSTTNHGQQIEVPSLAKLSLDMAEETLDDLNLRYAILDSANYNPDYPKYSVIEQIPKAGKFVKEDRKIYITLNPSGYRKIDIPEVVGRTRRQAEPTLLGMGFKIGKVSYRPYIAKDEVLELRFEGEKIVPGSELPKTSVIDLVLGDGSIDLRGNKVQSKNENSGGEIDDEGN